MLKLKKVLFAAVLGFVMVFASACGDSQDGKINVYAPDGATALAVAEMIDSGEKIGGKELSFKIVAASNISDALKTGEADLVIAPTNIPAKMYELGKPYKMAAVVTQGNLYMISKDTREADLNDLIGEVVGVIGMAATPDIIFRYILSISGIGYEISDTPVDGKIAVKYYADGQALIAGMKAANSVIKYGIMGEPLATTATGKIEGARLYMDIQEQYKIATDGENSYPQSILAVKDSLNGETEFLNAFIDKMSEGAAWAAANPDKAVAAIDSVIKDGDKTTLNNLTQEVVERCNINIVKTANSKQAVKAYFTAIATLDNELNLSTPSPNDAFYFEI